MASQLTVESVVRTIAETAVGSRGIWDALDSVAADGDFGTTMNRGFQAVLDSWPELDHANPRTLMTSVSETLSREMGGSSGPLWAVAFLRAGLALDSHGVNATGVVGALSAAIEAIQAYGGAQIGDKTLLDALIPAVDALAAAARDGEQDDPAVLLTAAADAAEKGARLTADIPATRGRAAYVGDRSIGAVDPGAAAVATIFARLAAMAHGDDVAPTLEFGQSGRASDATGRSQASGDMEPPPAKKFIDDPDQAVAQSLAAYALAHADLVVWEPNTRILRSQAVLSGRVGVVAGGGSGHEPMHGGFIGPGMLTAVAPGPVFASPTVHQVLAATLAADAGVGVLHLIKNYTGDVINFGIAGELAAERGVKVASLIIDDDVGLDEDLHAVGRRGTGATVLVEKIAGASAWSGASLDDVVAIARRAVNRSASFGVALGSCSPPGRGPILDLSPAEIEIGVGIHGEPGRRRDTIRRVTDIVEEAAGTILKALQPAEGAEFLALVSGLGATTLMEQYIVYGVLDRCVHEAGSTITRRLVGPYLTALDMPGVLITLLELDDELKLLWDAPVHTAGLRWGM